MDRQWKKIIRKLGGRAGETLVGVLVALIIVCLAVIIIQVSIATAASVNARAEAIPTASGLDMSAGNMTAAFVQLDYTDTEGIPQSKLVAVSLYDDEGFYFYKCD